MISLHGCGALRYDADPFVVRVTTNANRPYVVRDKEALLCQSPEDISRPGFRCFLAPSFLLPVEAEVPARVLELPAELTHLEDGDVIRCDPRTGEIFVTYRLRSTANTLLLTETCNNKCIMCCQPPKSGNDDYLASVALDTLRLMDRSTTEIGVSGGEPTLKWDVLLKVLRTAKGYLPDTAIQLLSNGRVFKYLSRAQELAAIRHPRLIVGVPLNSATPEVHDYIVQRRGVFDETILGIMNLKRKR
jgi:sulfatase maturation enzyme AslB (radical SAM superfamily)